MTLPVAPVVMPADLVGQPNGQLPAELLVDVGPSGKLHHTAARAWRAMVAAAADAGFPFTYTYGGAYRTLTQQTLLFESRYSPTGTGGGCKTYKGQQWCKKSSGLATAAVPGTSNHGLGLALDIALGTSPANAASVSSKAVDWLIANAARFGFSAELQSEAWHWRYVMGDSIPQAVLDFEGPTTAPPPPATYEVDMIAIDYKPNTPEWTALNWTGVELSHVVDGHADAVIRRAGVQRLTVNDVELDGVIRSSTTKTECPSAWVGTPRGAAWTSARG